MCTAYIIICIYHVFQTKETICADLQKEVCKRHRKFFMPSNYLYFFYQFLNQCNALQLIDQCLTLPCGVNAICDPKDGDFACSCPKDMVGDPTTKCEGNFAIFNNSSPKCLIAIQFCINKSMI